MKNETLLAGKCDKTSKIIMDISQYPYFFSPKYRLLLRDFFSSVTEFYLQKLSNLMDRSSKKPNLPSKCRSLVKYSPIWTILWKTCVFFNSGSMWNLMWSCAEEKKKEKARLFSMINLLHTKHICACSCNALNGRNCYSYSFYQQHHLLLYSQ